MKRLRILLILLLIPFAFPGIVLAHALPVQTIPEANAILERPPAQIEIFMSESLDPLFSEITVFDTAGNRVDNGDTEVDPADPTRVSVSVRTLPDGVYTVVWKVLSTVDGHVTAGSYPFAVGDIDPEALAAAGEASQQVSVSPIDLVARWLNFIAALSFAGGMTFITLVWQPASPSDAIQSAARPTWRRLSIIALSIFILANLVNMAVQAGLSSGGAFALPWQSAFDSVFFNTRGGAVILLRLLGAFVLTGLLLGDSHKGGIRRWVTFAVALFVLLTISLTSHSAASETPIPEIVLDWLHLAAAGVWIGGLLYFVTGLWSIRETPAEDRTAFLARVIPRFSMIAMPSVAVLVTSGIISAWPKLGPIANFGATPYGRTLFIKIALLIPLVGLGATNLLVITQRMKAAAESGGSGSALARTFRQIVTVEATLAVLILAAATLLTTIPPAAISAAPPSIDAETEADDLDVAMRVEPGRIGVNTFIVELEKDGQPVDDATEVSLRFTPTSVNIPPSDVELNNEGDGTYQVEGSYFSLPDSWQVQVSVRRSDAFDAFANLSFDVGVVRQSSSIVWSRIAGILLALAAIAYIFGLRPLTHSSRQFMALGIVPALALVLVGLFVFRRPPPVPEGLPVNPIPPNADSVAKGQELYTRNCEPCHGLSGRGDGPVGLTLNPSPADLTVHTAPGVHPDGQLYAWITDGFTGNTVMPVFRNVLTDEERWHIVNYIRTFGESN